MFGQKKTVSGILAAFNKTIEELQQVEREQEQEASRQAQAIEEARAAHNAAIAEAAEARSVASRLLAIVTPAQQVSLNELAKECA